MSFVAGALLLELLPDEAAAFGCFAAVVRDVLPGYYAPAMTALQVDQEVRRLAVGRLLDACMYVYIRRFAQAQQKLLASGV